MSVQASNILPPTSLISGATVLYTDTFDTGTAWERTTSLGYTVGRVPNSWWPDDGVTSATNPPITNNTISPYANIWGGGYLPSIGIPSIPALPAAFTMEVDFIWDVTSDPGPAPVYSPTLLDLFYNVDLSGNPPNEEIFMWVNTTDYLTNTATFTYYFQDTLGTVSYGDLGTYVMTPVFNGTFKVVVAASTMTVYLNGTLIGSVDRLVVPTGLWFFGMYPADPYEDFGIRRITIYDDTGPLPPPPVGGDPDNGDFTGIVRPSKTLVKSLAYTYAPDPAPTAPTYTTPYHPVLIPLQAASGSGATGGGIWVKNDTTNTGTGQNATTYTYIPPYNSVNTRGPVTTYTFTPGTFF